MSVPFQQAAFTVGEVGSALYGRQDLARTHIGASTMRNMFVRYTGGASSRAGTAFVGFSKQTGRDWPPRLIPFQFSVNQGLILEFGDEYMRVIQDGAFVLEPSLAITNISSANPAVVTVGAFTGGVSATPNNGAVTASYAPGERVTLAGGTYTTAAVLNVDTTQIKSLSVNAPGVDYEAGDTIALTGGTQTTPAELTVVTTKVVSAAISNAGAGGTPGPAVVTGTGGTGTKFQAIVTIDGTGVIISVNSISVAGSYTVNPTSPDPVTGGGLVGAELDVVLGIEAVSISDAGVFTENPSTASFTQDSTSGAGTGATFASAIMSIEAVTFSTAGAYTAFPANPVSQASTTGSGAGATFTVTSGSVSPYNTGDWVQIASVGGMTQVNGQTYVITVLTPTTFSLRNVYGETINSTAFGAYISGGTVSRVYTLETPWAEEDLAFLKFTQSADVMSICCLNQDTGTSYEPYELSRFANDSWTVEPLSIEPTIQPPQNGVLNITAAGTVNYAYVVTAVSIDGEESLQSSSIQATGANIALGLSSAELTWDPVSGARYYNIYKTTPGVNADIPVGCQYGYIGQSIGAQFVDSGIVPDFSQTPPLYNNPFAAGAVLSVVVTSKGTGYTTIGLTINTSTGSGCALQPALVSGGLGFVVVLQPGEGYLPTDTIMVTGDGAGATCEFVDLTPNSGTFPSVVTYLQQRRAYANTPNKPDTYFLSKPGDFTNFDTRIPIVDNDAITGNPWSVQVNGIQAIVNMPGGGVVLTGDDAWQLTGNGGSSLNPQPITPATQQAQPQAYNGCHTHIPPIKIDYDILYVQAKGSIVRNLSYQYFQNVYTGVDLTLNSPQLFTGYSLEEWTWTEEPFKVLWAVRDDGVLLSLTFVKPQEVAGWARHDTQGLFVSCASITEPPVDALYVAVNRFVGGKTSYMVERMDNRMWGTIEDAWCVDAGLSLPQPTPAATITASSLTGLGALTTVSVTAGGTGYSASTVASIVDDDGEGPGTGAVVDLTIVGGVITGAAVSSAGSGYTYPAISVSDPTNSGSGAILSLGALNNSFTVEATAAVFSAGDVGSVLRMGGGIATITTFVSTTEVTANMISPITRVVPNTQSAPPFPEGEWTMTEPVSSVNGLTHLAGGMVTGLADGVPLEPIEVPASGIVPLPSPASQVVLGLGFTAQLQTLYLDPTGVTWQGRRKKVATVVARVDSSGEFTIGSNQPDPSALSPIAIQATWQNMVAAPTSAVSPYNAEFTPLWTGDVPIPVEGGFNMRGQVAFEQAYPVPLNVLSCVNHMVEGDEPEISVGKRRRGSDGGA